MNKTLKTQLLKKGGKKALKEYNALNRIPPAMMNIGTRTHTDARHKTPKHKNKIYEED